MNEPWRIAVAIVFLGVLACGLFWVISADDDPAAPRNGAPSTIAPSTEAPSTGAVTVPASSPSLEGSTTSGAQTATSSPTPTILPPPDDVELRDVLPAAQRALSAWGEFAVTGDLTLVGDTFDPNGPQYQQLMEEAVTLAADPLGPPPYVFAMGEAELERPRAQRVILVGPVSTSRPGEPDQSFNWRLHLRWSGTDWLLWTVEEVEE